MKIFKRLVVVAVVVIVATVSLCIAWEVSPTWRTRSALKNCRFASLPASATSITHSYSGPLGPIGFLKHGLGSVSIMITFDADPSDVAEFIRKSPIMDEPYTTRLADGAEGQVDSMTSWHLTVNDKTNGISLSIQTPFP